MADSFVLSVHLTPRATADAIFGWQGETLRVRVKAPPVDGKANDALCRLIAAKLDISQSEVVVVTGQTARLKRLRVEGLTEEEGRARLGR